MRTDFDGGWVRRRRLGAGGYGTAYLWEQYDDNQNLQDWVVIKDCNMALEWDKVSVFSTDDRDVPREVAAHRTLTNPANGQEPGQRCILKYRGYRLIRWLKHCRIAVELAEGGDLANGDLYEDWHPHNQGFAGYNHPHYQPMPIDLVYRLFKALVLGCRHMHSKGLVHRDIKPENIFLRRIDINDDIMQDGEILPVLADFGLTIPVRPLRYENPTDADGVCTPFYAAPEQDDRIPPYVPDPNDPQLGHQIAEKATVFALAMTMWYVMLLGELPSDGDELWKRPRRYAEADDEAIYIRDWMLTPGSSNGEANDPFLRRHWDAQTDGQRLIDILINCLRRNPADRPSLGDLDEDIQAWLDNADDDDDYDSDRDDLGRGIVHLNYNEPGPGPGLPPAPAPEADPNEDEDEYEPPEYI